MEVEISLVPSWEVKNIWNKVEGFLKEATDMSEGRYDIEDLKTKLCAGEFQLWVVFDEKYEILAAITSSFMQYPKCKMLCGQFLGGIKMSLWHDKFVATFDNWARDNKCVAIEFSGRAGWGKVLAPHGYREVFRTYQRDL